MFITSYSPAASATSYVPATVPMNSFSKRYISSTQSTNIAAAAVRPIVQSPIPVFAPVRKNTVSWFQDNSSVSIQDSSRIAPITPRAPVVVPVIQGFTNHTPATFRAINTSFRSNMMTSRANQIASATAYAATAAPPPRRFTPESPDPEPAKNLWGGPTWFLFHTLAHKVDEAQFGAVRAEMLSIFYNICCNLPCPYCSDHARKHLDSINFQAIQTKDQLKRMLYEFHNKVNLRKGYPEFPYEQLDAKYNQAITVNIIQNFIVAFTRKTHNIRLLADDLKRRHIYIKLRTWFQQNNRFFLA